MNDVGRPSFQREGRPSFWLALVRMHLTTSSHLDQEFRPDDDAPAKPLDFLQQSDAADPQVPWA